MTGELKINVTNQSGKASRKISAALNNSASKDIPENSSKEFSLMSMDESIRIEINGNKEDKQHWFVKLSHQPLISMNLISEHTGNGWTLIIKRNASPGTEILQRAETVNVTIGDDKTGRPD